MQCTNFSEAINQTLFCTHARFIPKSVCVCQHGKLVSYPSNHLLRDANFRTALLLNSSHMTLDFIA